MKQSNIRHYSFGGIFCMAVAVIFGVLWTVSHINIFKYVFFAGMGTMGIYAGLTISETLRNNRAS